MKFGRQLFLILVLLLCSRAQGNAGFSTVIIDAGHGGHDRGGIPGQKLSEKEMTLDVARRLNGVLRGSGMRTIMTRSDDTFVSLPARSCIANGCSNAVFVSIHFNSAPRVGASGFETYYYQSKAARLAAKIHCGIGALAQGENRGIKRRGFYVLRKTRIPAVLCEPGFLTNASYAKLMLKPSSRQRLASCIGSAIMSASRD